MSEETKIQWCDSTASPDFSHRIKAAVVGWLRYDQRCPLVCCERTPFDSSWYRPDIIGVDRRRRVIEVEIKQSVADFKANYEKRGVKFRLTYPFRFYFAVPRVMKEECLLIMDELSDNSSGLLTLGLDRISFGPAIEVIRKAKHDQRAKRLTVLQTCRMVMHQTGTLHRALLALSRNNIQRTNPPATTTT